MSNKVFYPVLFSLYITLSASACRGNQRETHTLQDTVILGSNSKVFTINQASSVHQAVVTITGRPSFSPDKKVWLLLDRPAIVRNPDGVYELYLSGEKNINTLTSSHIAFVNVLDLYSLTASDAPRQIAVDLSRNWAGLNKNGNPPPTLYLTILFRGNNVNGVESKQAGEMIVKGFRIIQEK
jgi:hypothetical protein